MKAFLILEDGHAINQQFGTNLAVANISGFVYAMIALGLNQSGFMAEIIRAVWPRSGQRQGT